ncbi:MAG: NIPSNAP family protein [Gammaproteobacteria bacterium]
MIIDHRTYTFHPGKIGAWLELFEKEALPIQQKFLGKLIGFFVSEVGPLNQAVFLWAYDSMGDREQRRAAMEADPAWAEFRKKSGALGALMAQENKILKPVGFSPLK